MAEQLEVRKRTVKNTKGLVIGIDPDLVKSGLAVVDNGELVRLYAMSFSELVEFAKC